MEVESISDVLHWGEAFHAGLAGRLHNSNSKDQDERVTMLMQYLAEQEEHIAKTFREYSDAASMEALKTWSYDYHRTFPMAWREEFDTPYAGLSVEQLIGNIETEHNKVIDFLENLKSKALVDEVVELLQQLVDYEQSEAARMAQSANRLLDI